jgi:hypothetical protein
MEASSIDSIATRTSFYCASSHNSALARAMTLL